MPLLATYYGPSTFSADDQYLAIGALVNDFQGAFVWSLSAAQLVGVVPAYEFAFVPNSPSLLAVGLGSVRAFSFDGQHSLETICRITENGKLSTPEFKKHAPGFDYVDACP